MKIVIEVGRGLYLRSLAHDLGQELGCGAYLQELTRLRSGPFRLAQAVPLEDLDQKFGDQGRELMSPLDEILLPWKAVVLSPVQVQAVERGQALYFETNAVDGARCRAYTDQGILLAVMRFQSGQGWRPFKTFPTLNEQGPLE